MPKGVPQFSGKHRDGTPPRPILDSTPLRRSARRTVAGVVDSQISCGLGGAAQEVGGCARLGVTMIN